MAAAGADEKTGPAIDVAADPSPAPDATGKAMEAELPGRFRSGAKLRNDFQTHRVDGVWHTAPSNLSNEWLSPRFWRTLGFDAEEMTRRRRPGATTPIRKIRRRRSRTSSAITRPGKAVRPGDPLPPRRWRNGLDPLPRLRAPER